jgi:aspartate carbamoyltransferase catalytic subunit
MTAEEALIAIKDMSEEELKEVLNKAIELLTCSD